MSAVKTRFATMKVAELKPAPYNPRSIDSAAMAGLTKSYERFGLVQPIIVNERSGFVVGGHQRLKVLRAKKVRETDVVVVDLDDKDEKALNIALNNAALTGDFTSDLQALLAEIETADGALFGDLRFDELLAEIAAPKLGGEDPDEIPEVPPVAVTQPGDIWTLGRHRILCGDSTNPDDVAKLLGDQRVDFCLTDPPYSVNYKTSFSKAERGHLGMQQLYQESGDSGTMLSVLRHLPNLVVMTYPIDRHFFELANALQSAGYNSVRELVWVKSSPTFHPGATYQQMHEPVLILRRADTRFPATIPADAKTVLAHDRPSVHGDHPTEKPMALWQTLLEWHTTRGQVVHDPFCGSGTTLIACEMARRQCLTMEIIPNFCDVAVQRWSTLTGKTATRNGHRQNAIVPARAAA